MRRRRRDGRCVVEIAGVAGAGKSTLAQALLDELPDAAPAATLQLRRTRQWRDIGRAIPSLVRMSPTWRLAQRAPDLTELKLMMYVGSWSHRLRRGDGLVLVDQGPVYALARLAHTLPPVPGTEVGGAWWEESIRTWAAALDMVVWLDASDDELWRRVNARPRHHDIKGATTIEGTAYLQRYRECYQHVLDGLESHDGPAVLRFDTGRRTAVDITAEVSSRLSGGDGRGVRPA